MKITVMYNLYTKGTYLLTVYKTDGTLFMENVPMFETIFPEPHRKITGEEFKDILKEHPILEIIVTKTYEKDLPNGFTSRN